jgi:hypothetical protein
MARTLPKTAPQRKKSPTRSDAVLDEDRGDRAAAAVEFGFEHVAEGGPGGVGLEILDLGDQENVFEQQIEIGLLLEPKTARTMVSPPQSSAWRPCSMELPA